VDPSGNAWPVNDKNEIAKEVVDAWVLTGALTVKIDGDTSRPQAPVELRIKLHPTMPGQTEYDLITPAMLNVGASGTWEHLPLGQVIVEVRRGGTLLERDAVVYLDSAQNDTSIYVKPP
jgi:hypothetical protein